MLFTQAAALLLWLSTSGETSLPAVAAAHPEDGWSAWRQYLGLLPQQQDLSCLLCFRPQEADWLQVPELRVSGLMQDA